MSETNQESAEDERRRQAIEDDVMHPAQRVYAMAVVAADREYKTACRAAWDKRQQAIDEALAACLLAMQEREKGGPEGPPVTPG